MQGVLGSGLSSFCLSRWIANERFPGYSFGDLNSMKRNKPISGPLLSLVHGVCLVSVHYSARIFWRRLVPVDQYTPTIMNRADTNGIWKNHRKKAFDDFSLLGFFAHWDSVS